MDIIRELHAIITHQPNCSDIHLSTNEPIWGRVQGHMLRLSSEHINDTEIRHFLKIVLSTEQPESLAHQRGGYDFAHSFMEKRFRCNLYLQGGSLSVVMRVLNEHIPDIKTLGLPTSIQQQAEQRKGCLIVTGPTGSGKSTTLASILNYINKTRKAHIITLEDPVEYIIHPEQCKITRREIGQDTPTFGAGVRASLRQDPDVLMIGELRDRETVKAALEAAATGHLVLTTLHTNNTVETVQRMMSFFDGSEQIWARHVLAAVLNAVISQNLLMDLHHKPTLAYEIMVCTQGIRQAILDNKIHQIVQAMEQGRLDGQVMMHDVLCELVHSGRISIEDARYASHDLIRFNQALGET